ncbi:MAG: polymer-forming cytoskeletal protein [Thermodesulfobacteriota bacterium]
MSLFSREKDRASSIESDSKGAIASIIGKEMAIVGDISFKGKIRIDGSVEGNVKGGYLVLGEAGKIIGDVESSVVVCLGQVDGNMVAKKLNLMKGGVVNGRVETADLSVEPGGVLNGEIKAMKEDLPTPPGKSTATLASPAIKKEDGK